MASQATIKINDFFFQPDGPIGITYGFNGPHATEAQLFVDMAALGASRVRYNVVMDLIVGNAKFSKPLFYYFPRRA